METLPASTQRRRCRGENSPGRREGRCAAVPLRGWSGAGMEQKPGGGRCVDSGGARPCCPVGSLPRGLALGPSLSVQKGLGVWCVGSALRPGMLLGPREEHVETIFQSPCWKESSTGNMITSWKSLVKQSRNEGEANVTLEWLDGKLHIRICSPVAAGTELLYWLTQPQADAACLEENSPASKPDDVAVAEKAKLQELLAVTSVTEGVALVKQRGPSPDGNAEDCFSETKSKDPADVSKILEVKAGDHCVPVLNNKLPTKQFLDLGHDPKKGKESRTLQSETREAKRQSIGSQLLASHPVAIDEQGKKDAVPHVLPEQVNEGVTEATLTDRHSQPPPSGAICLDAGLARKRHKMEVLESQFCAEDVTNASQPRETLEGQEKNQEEEFNSRKGAATQLKEAGSERRHRCEECGKAFLQLCHLKKHRFVHTDHKPFLCTECGKSYSSEESFRAHTLGHRGVRPFPCSQCHKTYGTKRDLQEHQVLHTGQRPFVCPDCGKSFARRPSLRIHRKTHQAKEPNPSSAAACQCVICGRQLANPGSLRNHMRLHTGERPYTCPYCPKSFRQQGNLRGHLRLHTGERPYRCHFCGDTFPQRPELRRHLISHTGEAHLCTVCGKELRDPHTLRAHERLHTGERPFRCHLCPKSYPLATKLRRHQKAHHGDKPYQCSLCGMGYALPQNLRRHQLEHKSNLCKDVFKPVMKGPEQPTVLVVHSVDVAAAVNKAEFLITEDRHCFGKQQNSVRRKDVIEITLSDAEEECIIVQEQGSPSDMLIIQEDIGFNTVAEVEVGT